ncbi:MAG TPA: flavin reductase family protein [Gemmatimonadales bacterium]|nr:flavin reductase family protein [Gemmatimonadales bacterium]
MASRIRKRRLPLPSVYRQLEPGPVVLLTTAKAGRPNVMPMSWHTMLEFNPPLIGCVVSDRNYSFQALRATRECVINIPTATHLREVVGCGNVSGRRVDKFARFGLTPVSASSVAPPLILECPVNIECRVTDTRLVNQYCFFIMEAVAAWQTPGVRLRTIHHQGMGHFMIAGATRLLRSRAK